MYSSCKKKKGNFLSSYTGKELQKIFAFPVLLGEFIFLEVSGIVTERERQTIHATLNLLVFKG